MNNLDNSWIKSAVLLGLSFFIAVFLVKPVGVSTQFSVLSGMIHSSVNKNVIYQDQSRKSGYASTNEYYDRNDGAIAEEIKNPINYGFVFVLSIPIGSYTGYLLKRKKKAEKEATCSIKQMPFREYIMSFIGGFILLFAARMADGCTSGHMMSGMMQGSVSGYVFAFSVFLTAIPSAIIFKKLKNK